MSSVDYIIVGQGLAGSTLALHLMAEGKSVKVFDTPQDNRSSAIAAGLFNPITGKVLSKTWMAEQLYPYLAEFYSFWEQELTSSFYYPSDLYRPFLSVGEQNDWMALSSHPSVRPFVKKIFTQPAFSHCYNPYGGILLNHCGHVDVNSFMQAVRDILVSKGGYESAVFHETEVILGADRIKYQTTEAKAIIFCDGVRSLKGRFFNWLPIRPLKGETITIQLKDKPEVVFNRGVYIVPSGENYKVGATYSHHPVEGISNDGKRELEQKLQELITMPYEIVDQDWGIRPTTPDRKPILGSHFAFKNVIVFNGLGTKGVSQAPYFARQLCHWLVGKGEIQQAVNIERFKTLYSKSLE